MIPFHGLRDTSATLLISANQDIATVAKRLGHAHASVTLDIYTHALEKNDRGASDALENMLKGQVGSRAGNHFGNQAKSKQINFA